MLVFCNNIILNERKSYTVQGHNGEGGTRARAFDFVKNLEDFASPPPCKNFQLRARNSRYIDI